LCTHVSALLYALVAVTPTRFPERSSMGEDPEATEILPVMGIDKNLICFYFYPLFYSIIPSTFAYYSR